MTLRKALIILCMLAALCLTACGHHAKPEERGRLYIEDVSDLLSDEEESGLRSEMEKLLEYGSAAFVSVGDARYSGYNAYDSSAAGRYAKQKYEELIGPESGLLFLIDMDNREIYIYTYGFIGDYVSRSKARSITDNVYRYATDKQYGTCATKAFEQINTLMNGGKIAESMRYISNAFVAVLIALLINMLALRALNRKKEVTAAEVADANKNTVQFRHKGLDIISRKVVVLRSSSSGGRGGFGGGGGHFGGHGGGHRF